MALPGGRACTWTLLLCLNWVFFDGVAAGPWVSLLQVSYAHQIWCSVGVITVRLVCFCGCRQFMVTIPAVIEVGSMSRLCASLLQPNESLAMTATLTYNDNKMVIFERVSDTQFHQCTTFQVLNVQLALLVLWSSPVLMLPCFFHRLRRCRNPRSTISLSLYAESSFPWRNHEKSWSNTTHWSPSSKQTSPSTCLVKQVTWPVGRLCERICLIPFFSPLSPFQSRHAGHQAETCKRAGESPGGVSEPVHTWVR